MNEQRYLDTNLKAFFQLLRESTRKIAASVFIQSQCSKVYFSDASTRCELNARLLITPN